VLYDKNSGITAQEDSLIMSLFFDQLVYTSFPKVGFRVFASAQVPTEIQQAFVQQVVNRHWNAYNPPRSGYRAAYLHQVAPAHNLFGWLYNDGLDDLNRNHVPYFICYYLTEFLDTVQLENILTCLRRGPIELIDRQSLPDILETIVIPDLWSYQPARLGVAIPSGIHERCQIALKQRALLDLFVPLDQERVIELNAQRYEQQETDISTSTHDFVEGIQSGTAELSELTIAADLNAEAAAIEAEALKAYQAYKEKLQPYERKFSQAIQREYPLSDETCQELKRLQHVLGLRDEDIAPIKARMTRQVEVVPSPERIARATRDQIMLHGEVAEKAQQLNEALVVEAAKTAKFPGTAPSQSRRRSQMKIALLIGVSSYGPGFDALPGAEKDVEAMKQVLGHPEIGDFTEVQTLINPNRQVLAEAIEALSLNRQRDDLILLYFSGHGVKDDKGNVYLTTCITRRDAQQKLVRSTVTPASFLCDVMNDSQSKQQIVILDCCFNEAVTKDEPVKANSFVDVKQQLGGQGRVVLTSSTSTQCYFAQKGSELSAYTFYLVEGLKTGAADLDDDGAISIHELHEYTRRKVQEATPAIRSKIYGKKEGQDILVAKAPIRDPKLRYRKEVERCASRGEVSLVNRTILDVLQNSLGLTSEEATAIEAGVLKPHQEYQKKLQEYAQVFTEAIQHEVPVSGQINNRFKRIQQTLGLTDEDIVPLEAQIIRQIKVVQSHQAAESIRLHSSSSSENTPPAKQLLNKAQLASKVAISAVTGRMRSLKRYIQRNLNIDLAASTDSSSTSVHRNSWFVAGAGAATVLILIGIASGARHRYESQQLKTIKMLAQQRNYEECIAQAQKIPQGSGHFTSAQRFLNRCEAGVNWQNAQVQTLSGHAGAVWTVALSPDEQTLASGGEDNKVKLWNLSNGKLLHTFAGHKDTVWTVAISPDSQTLVSGSGDHKIKIWNLASGRLIRTLTGHGDRVISVAISPDGQTLASGSGDGTIKIWNLVNGRLLYTLTGHTGIVRSVAISPDGQTLASGSGDRTIKLWNLANGRLIRTLTGHGDRVISVAISSDGQILASGSRDKTAKTWNLSNGKLLRTFSDRSDWVNSVTISPDGRTLAGSTGGVIKIWNLYTGELLHTTARQSSDITSICFSADGKILANSNQDKTIEILRR
jgi:uncharacterized caspase-like protein